MGYDALNIGKLDLAMGLDFLLTLRGQARFTFISSNLVDKKTHQPLFKPYLIKIIKGYKVGIFGVLPAEATGENTEFTILDPFIAAAEIVTKLKKQADLIVCLSNLGITEDKKLCKAVSGIQIIIGSGGSRSLLAKPVVEGKTIILQAFQKGEYMGILEVLEIRSIKGSTQPYRYRNTVVALDEKYPEHRDIKALVSEFKLKHTSTSRHAFPFFTTRLKTAH